MSHQATADHLPLPCPTCGEGCARCAHVCNRQALAHRAKQIVAARRLLIAQNNHGISYDCGLCSAELCEHGMCRVCGRCPYCDLAPAKANTAAGGKG